MVNDETEAKVRADRAAAEEYAQRVLNGEEPWNDDVEPDPGFDESPPKSSETSGKASSKADK